MARIAGVGLCLVSIGQMETDMKRVHILLLFLFLSPGIAYAGSQQIKSVVMMAKSSGELAATDDFTGDGDLSANWTSLGNLGALSASTAVRDTNLLQSSSYNTYAAAIYTGRSFVPDQYAQGLLTTGIGGNGVMVRMTSDGNGYVGLCTTTTSCRISRSDGGTLTIIGSAFTVSSPAGQDLKLTASGSTLELFLGGASLGTRTDATYTSGYPGLRAYTNNNSASMDDFKGGSL